jgi:hypothetical protein
VSGLALAAALAIGGCGGSKAGGITKAQYIARASAVCIALEARAKTLGASSKTFLQAVEATVAARRQAEEQLQAIPRPASDPQPSEWLQSRGRAIADSEKTLHAKGASAADRAAAVAAEHTDMENARAIAKAYGLKACTGY